jgi:hypothetical protein
MSLAIEKGDRILDSEYGTLTVVIIPGDTVKPTTRNPEGKSRFYHLRNNIILRSIPPNRLEEMLASGKLRLLESG